MKKQLTALALMLAFVPALHAQDEQAPGAMDPEAEGLEKVRGKFSETWVNPNADFSQYDKLLFGEAEFQFRDVGPAQRYRTSTLRTGSKSEFGVPEEEQKKFEEVVAEAFDKEMSRSKKFDVVNDAVPGTLLIEGAVLDIVSHVPPEMVGRSNTYLASIATATLVLEIHDAITGETLAYVEERRKITPPGGNRIDSFSMPTSSVTVWADISRWARSAASRLRSGLEKAQKG